MLRKRKFSTKQGYEYFYEVEFIPVVNNEDKNIKDEKKKYKAKGLMVRSKRLRNRGRTTAYILYVRDRQTPNGIPKFLM